MSSSDLDKVTYDISKREKAEDALRIIEARYRALYHDNPTMIVTLDADMKMLSVNPCCASQLGYTINELEGQSVLKLFHEDDRSAVAGQLQKCLQNPNQVHRWQFRKIHKDGSLLWVDETAQAVSDLSGELNILVVCQDVTERKRAEDALRESEERFRATFNQAAVGIGHVTPDGRWLRINQKYCDVVGYTEEEIKGLTVMEITHPDDLETSMKNYRLLLEGKLENYSLEKRYIRKDGSTVWVNLTASMVFDESGNPMFAVSVVEDISKRKRAEETLREAENKFSKAFQATPSVLVIASLADGRYLEVNEAFERVIGYRRDEVIGRSSLEFNIWQNREDRANVLRILAEGKKVRDLEIGFQSKSGQILDCLYSAEIIEIGSQQCLLSLLSDITARKKTEAELRRSEERYRVLYNGTPVMLHSIDHEGRLVSVSDYWLDTLGYERSEVLGRFSSEFLSPASRAYAIETVLPDFFRTGSCKEVPYQIVKKNNEVLDVLLSEIAERDSEGKVVRSLAVLVDVTERKRAEEEIERLNTDLTARAVDLEYANRELESFNYTVAHDLRNPLNVISSYCQVVKEMCGSKLDEQCKGYIQETYNGTLRMNRLIEALLDFSQMAHAKLNRERVDLSNMAKEVAEELKGTDPGRRVEIRIADGINVDGDEVLLRVVLENFFGNAWKYTSPREEAVIEFGMKEIDGKPAYFVRDNGAGFDNAVADKLFAPFQRLPGAEEFRGFGIGLATVERIIRRHGGKVWAEGELGKGATFWFTVG